MLTCHTSWSVQQPDVFMFTQSSGLRELLFKESFSFKTRMAGTVKCRPTVAY